MTRDSKKKRIQLDKLPCENSQSNKEIGPRSSNSKEAVSGKNQINEIDSTPESNTGESKQNKEILVGEKSVKELVKLLETKLDTSNLNNIKYCEQNFHFQRETLRYLKKKKNRNFE